MKLSDLTSCLFLVPLIILCCVIFREELFETDYEKVADAITAKVAKKIRREKNLILIGTGGGMMDDIKMMAMSFCYYQEVDIEDARKLLVYCVEEYLNAINASEKVRPYLHNHPFTAKNVEIRLFISQVDTSDVALGRLCGADAIKGDLNYYADNADRYTLKRLHEETYEEAFRIVNEESSTVKKEA